MEITVENHPEEHRSSVLFTGDSCLGRDHWEQHPLSQQLTQYISKSDFAITNLEGSFKSDFQLNKQGPNLQLPNNIYNKLDKCGFDGVSLANNHSMDFGSKGLEKNLEKCSGSSLESTGAGLDIRSAVQPISFDIDETSVGVFAVSEHSEQIVSESSAGVCWYKSPKIISYLKEKSKDFDVSVLMAHGGVEYSPIPPANWRRTLREFASLDFDVIISHHPHCPQSWEVYNKTPIFYSLGNFFMYRKNTPGMNNFYAVNVVLDNSQVSKCVIIPMCIGDGIVEMMADNPTNEFRKYLLEFSGLIQDKRKYEDCWKFIATELYEDRYHEKFVSYGVGSLVSLIYTPVRELGRLTRGCMGEYAQREKMIALLDYTENSSHQNTVRTALDIKVGNDSLPSCDNSQVDIERWRTYFSKNRKENWKQTQTKRISKAINRIL